MNPDIKAATVQETEFILRRMEEGFPWWSVFIPVAFGYLVVLLIMLFQRERRLMTLLIGGGVVTALAIPYLIAFLVFFAPNAITLLAPFLAIGLFYIGVMYYRDSQSINPYWATFLGTLRTLVYAILAFVFLLPGCQSYDKTETDSRVLVLLDVSGSMSARDDQPTQGQDPTTLPTRQDKVIEFLSRVPDGQDRNVLERLLTKSPVVLYRFGGAVDREPVFLAPNGKGWSKDALTTWLKPDKKDIKIPANVPPDQQDKYRRDREALYDRMKDATDTFGSALEVVQRESAGSHIQAVIMISDGQRNKGGEEALRDLLVRASNPKRPIQIITVGVGEYRPPVRIRLNPVLGPSTVRPDDGPFSIRVPVFGDGLAGEKFNVTLYAKRTRDRDGKVLEGAKEKAVDTKSGQFSGGEHPYAEVEFVVDLEKFANLKHKDDEKKLLQGTWEFTAKIPRHPKEITPKAEHVSDPPTPVGVLDNPLRVLLVASGPNRDYQFARTLLDREVREKRLELSVFLQTSAGLSDVDQDVEGERFLTEFPNQLEAPLSPENKLLHFKSYDVIVAFDVNWGALKSDQMEKMKAWVGEHGGAFVLVGGPVYTDRLARPGGPEVTKLLKPLYDIMPVKLNDTVFQSIQAKGKAPDRTRAWPLKFTGNAKGMEFLKLDEESEVPLAGWNEFFWGTKEAQPGKQPKRGFHSYHPVEELKPTAEVLAYFGDPDAPKIEQGKHDMPYLVAMRYDKGKTFYVGSGELWRLRLFKEGYYERFLVKLLRYVSGGGLSKRIGTFSMGPEYVAGNIPIEAVVLDKDGGPLKQELKPEVIITRPAGFDPKEDKITPDKTLLAAKKVEQGKRWSGIFSGVFPAETPGVYTVQIKIPGAEPFSHQFVVTPPNLEMGNLKTNFEELKQMSSDAAPALARITDDATRERLRVALDLGKNEVSSSDKLFFKLKSAAVIPELLTKVPPDVQSVKGKFKDLWDQGSESGWALEFHLVMMITVGAICLLAAAILFFIGRPILAGSVLGGGAAVVLGFLMADVIWSPPWLVLPIELSWLLVLVVGLLSAEWLTRKLLKLA